MTEEDVSESVISLSNVLESLMAKEFQNIGFLFTGQTVTVAFWRSQEQLYLFDPHPVNENRTHDLENDINNLARLFQRDTFPALASLLLSNAALDGSVIKQIVHNAMVGRFTQYTESMGVPMAEWSKTLDFESELEIAQVRILSVTVAFFISTIDLVLYRLSPLFCLIRSSHRPVAHEDGQYKA
ncbi:hypothetical protein J6590_072351 [Homalodisca vitripennis]|nr:hypothetical protein J6590_072351 [Homalodisca vitripennis]